MARPGAAKIKLVGKAETNQEVCHIMNRLFSMSSLFHSASMWASRIDFEKGISIISANMINSNNVLCNNHIIIQIIQTSLPKAKHWTYRMFLLVDHETTNCKLFARQTWNSGCQEATRLFIRCTSPLDMCQTVLCLSGWNTIVSKYIQATNCKKVTFICVHFFQVLSVFSGFPHVSRPPVLNSKFSGATRQVQL